jgi:hypothetical protein
MSNLKATHNIEFPEVRTYWIAYTNTEIFSYGYIDPDQELNSGQPYLYSTTNEDEWILELRTEFGVLYPDLPSGEVWGYQYDNEDDGLIDENKLKEADYDAPLEYSTDFNFWYIIYQEGMQDVLEETPTHFQVSES